MLRKSWLETYIRRAFQPIAPFRQDPGRTPIYVRDEIFYTSAGVTAGIDMALAIVEQDYGHAVATQVAQDLVVFLRRPGGQ